MTNDPKTPKKFEDYLGSQVYQEIPRTWNGSHYKALILMLNDLSSQLHELQQEFDNMKKSE